MFEKINMLMSQLDGLKLKQLAELENDLVFTKAIDIILLKLTEDKEEVATIITATEESRETAINKMPPEELTETSINRTLMHLGMRPGLKGYYFIKSALLLMVDDESIRSKGITKYLYPTIAKQYNTTSTRVERAIRHSIECLFYSKKHYEPFNVFLESTGTRNKMTNTEFLYSLLECMKTGVL